MHLAFIARANFARAAGHQVDSAEEPFKNPLPSRAAVLGWVMRNRQSGNSLFDSLAEVMQLTVGTTARMPPTGPPAFLVQRSPRKLQG